MTHEPGPKGRVGPTEGVKILHGDPRKAMLKLSIPMIVAISAQTIYNLVDAIWVSGIGADALAAVGLFFPFFFMSMAIGTGIGIGGSAAVSRYIGAKNKAMTDAVATHTVVLMVIAAVLFTVPLFIFAEPLFLALGAGDIVDLTVAYAQVMFGGTIIVFFSNIALSLLRGEGDAKRPMYAMLTGSILNIILDPLFIFKGLGPLPGLGLGIAGAAWATMLSMGISSALLFYWLFLRKDTYMDFRFKGFSFRGLVLIDIFRVGVPASVQYISMSFMMMLMNGMIIIVGGTDGVAIFSTGWRVTTMATLPILGLGMGVTAVAGAAYGMKDYRKLDIGFMFAVRTGFFVELVLIIFLYALAPNIASIFTTSEASAHIYSDLVVFLRTMCFFLPIVPLGMLSSAMFQGTGKGMYALIVTLIRTLILVVPLAWTVGVIWLGTLEGIWMGLVMANMFGAMVSFSWARVYIDRLKRFRVEDDLVFKAEV